MNKLIFVTLVFILFSCAGNETKPPVLSTLSPNAFLIAFGSCNQHNYPQPLWKVINDIKPNVFVWTGDIVYADASSEKDSRLAEYLNIQKNIPDYVQLRSQAKVIGVWDDHDFGINNGGKVNPVKKMYQRLVLDFLDEPKNSPRRKQNGIYTSYKFTHLNEEIKVILLDGRFNRDDPGLNSDVLGKEQWSWLEHELKSSKAKVNIIVSGIQVLPNQHPFERWGDFPKAKDKLFNLIKSSKAKGVFFLSGDRHFAEISRLNVTGIEYPLIDVTSSGMTHFFEGANETNALRINDLYAGLNFGLISIQWEKDQSLVTLSVLDQKGNVRISHLQEYPF
ncbi:MAG: alkaline phosphatase D family protein [Bacteriovoracaceae bacterium]